MISNKSGAVYGYHRRKAMEAGSMWRIHWVSGQVSVALPTDAAFTIVSGKMDAVLFMENMDIAPYIDKVMNAMEEGIILGFSFMDGSYYIEEEQWKHGKQEISSLDMRRRLQNHYTHDMDMIEEDMSYIEERTRELA